MVSREWSAYHPGMSRPIREPVGLRLTRASRTVSRAFDRALAEAGGTVPVWLVLISLKSGRPENQRQLAESIGIREATLTHHLNSMEGQGLVSRRRSAQNHRVQLLELTDAGEELFQRLRTAAVAFDERLKSGFDPADVDLLDGLLGRLEGNVRATVSPD